MKLLSILIGSILLCAGCATSSIHILEKKEPTRPYTKILAIYLEEGCEFSMLDSTTYNICIRSCFMKTDTEALKKTTPDANIISRRIKHGKFTTFFQIDGQYFCIRPGWLFFFKDVDGRCGAACAQ